MPLPWNKHRISQLVADLQSPAKRRGSMVVETGFPTSIVDLFVKNRDRLRRTSSKKLSRRRGTDSSDLPSTNLPPIEIPVTPPPQASPTEGVAVTRRRSTAEFVRTEAVEDLDNGRDSLASRVSAAPPQAIPTEGVAVARRRSTAEFVRMEAVEGLENGRESVVRRVSAAPPQAIPTEGVAVARRRSTAEVVRTEVVEGLDNGRESVVRRVSAAVVKTVVVVALALSTEKLVVGIALSAFALLLIEYFGKFIDVGLGLCLKPCSRLLDSIQRGFSIFRKEKPSRRLEKSKASKAMVCDSIHEIESVEDTKFEEEEIGDDVNMRIASDENENENDKIYIMNQSRRSRIKSKFIKKCVPKKLRDLKKKRKETILEEYESENTSYFNTQCQENCEETELVGEKTKDESQIPFELPRSSLERSRRGRTEGNHLGYQALVVIALVGLIGGRIWALAFTILWCIAIQFLRKSNGNAKCT